VLVSPQAVAEALLQKQWNLTVWSVHLRTTYHGPEDLQQRKDCSFGATAPPD